MKAKGLDQFKRGLLTPIVLRLFQKVSLMAWNDERIDELSYGVFEMKAGTLSNFAIRGWATNQVNGNILKKQEVKILQYNYKVLNDYIINRYMAHSCFSNRCNFKFRLWVWK